MQTQTFHRAVVHGETIYLSGVVADDKALTVGGQTRQILEKVDSLLKRLNSDMSRLLSATVYLTDMSHKDEMNAIWTTFLKPKDLPARATVGVAQLGPQTLIEVAAIAATRTAVADDEGQEQ